MSYSVSSIPVGMPDFTAAISAVIHFKEQDAPMTARALLRVAAIVHLAACRQATDTAAQRLGRADRLRRMSVGRKSFEDIAKEWPENLQAELAEKSV